MGKLNFKPKRKFEKDYSELCPKKQLLATERQKYKLKQLGLTFKPDITKATAHIIINTELKKRNKTAQSDLHDIL